MLDQIIKETDGLINLNILSNISTILLVLGSAIILVSLFGLIGACCGNKLSLILYEILLVFVFIGHLILLILAMISFDDIQTKILNNLEDSVVGFQDYSITDYYFGPC